MDAKGQRAKRRKVRSTRSGDSQARRPGSWAQALAGSAETLLLREPHGLFARAPRGLAGNPN